MRVKRRTYRRLWLATASLVVVVLALGIITAVSGGHAKPARPTAFQRCVTSIKAEPASQVIGFTPACLQLPLATRDKAINAAGR